MTKKNNLALIESDSVVVSMTRASQALAEAVTVGQTKTLIDVAYAAEIYSKRHHLSEEAIGRATSVKVEATRKLGEILMATPKNVGAKGSAVPNRNRANLDPTPTLEELGLSKKESAVAQKLAALPEAQFEQVRLGNVTIAKAIAAVDSTPKEAPQAPVVKPEVPPKDDGPDAAELAANEAATRADMASLQKLLDSDDKLATAHSEIKRLNAELAVVKLARDGYMNKCNEQIKMIKTLQRKLDKVSA